MRRKALGQAQAFTLAEIVLVVGLIGLLAAPNGWALRRERQTARSWISRRLAESAQQGIIDTRDLLGNPCAISPIGSNQVMVSTATKSAFRQ